MNMNVARSLFCWKNITFSFLLILLVLFPDLSARLQADERSGSPFYRLQRKLAAEGLREKKLYQYYSDPGVAFEAKAVSRYFHHREASLNYDQFLSRASIGKARKYLKKHHDWLIKAEAAYKVDKEIITAILLVETRLGTFVGNVSTLNILSSMAMLADSDVRDMLWVSIVGKTNLTRKQFNQKAATKSRWAYSELVAFLTYVNQENIRTPVEIPGSYAGAVGIAQFLPSNILKLGVDGDKDGQIDLFTHADAIFSVANYLHHHGWRPGMSDAEARQALFAYNHSTYYVDALMQIFQKLKNEK